MKEDDKQMKMTWASEGKKTKHLSAGQNKLTKLGGGVIGLD